MYKNFKRYNFPDLVFYNIFAGLYGRVFENKYYGLTNKYALLNELLNIIYLGVSSYVVWLILQLTNVNTPDNFYKSINLFNRADSLATANKQKIFPGYKIGKIDKNTLCDNKNKSTLFC